MKKLAIITARGGSKRIPRKNIKEFCGKPIIQYTIDAALQSKAFDTVMVSTDDEEIAHIAKTNGAEVPFMRSEGTSTDTAITADVLLEVLLNYKEQGSIYEQFCCLYPAAPFITSNMLTEAMELLSNNNADSVVPVVRFSFPPQRGFIIKDGFAEMKYPENLNTRSQDLEPMYHDSGQFYCAKTEPFMKHKKIFMPNLVPYIISELDVHDIDTEEDWAIAEWKYKYRKR